MAVYFIRPGRANQIDNQENHIVMKMVLYQ